MKEKTLLFLLDFYEKVLKNPHKEIIFENSEMTEHNIEILIPKIKKELKAIESLEESVKALNNLNHLCCSCGGNLNYVDAYSGIGSFCCERCEKVWRLCTD